MSQARAEAALRRARGARAEALAAAHLRASGLAPIARNYATRRGELDIVCLDGPVLVFVEVRYRKLGALVDGAQSVTPAKQHRIRLAAMQFIDAHPDHAERPCRFDVVTVSGDQARPRVRWIRDAFAE